MHNVQSDLRELLISRRACVAIVGLGYVGLPLAIAFADAGFRVVGIDVDPFKVDAINAGESYISDVPRGYIRRLQASGRLRATTDYSAIAGCDAVSVCVPTPLNKLGDPDISYIVASMDEVVKYTHPGMILVLESTTYPGTTTEVVLPILEKSEKRLKVGEDVFLAFSPERVDPGRTDWTTRNTPRVIGGITPACLDVAMAYYGQAIERLVPVSSTEAAEMAKLLENTFRAINIGLANEIMLMCDKLGLDVWEVIDAAATKPFGFMKFVPGPGLGGHCIPIDPLYLSWRLKRHNYRARFIELAADINTSMPAYWVQKVQDALNKVAKAINGSNVLVLGITYKRDTPDVRESPALDIIRLLAAKGANVSYHDPHVPSLVHDGARLTCVLDLDDAVRSADCVLVVADHTSYDWDAISRQASLVVDTRNVLPAVSTSLQGQQFLAGRSDASVPSQRVG